MATHSSVLAWRIPWTEEPGGLQLRGSGKSQTLLSTHPEGSSWAGILYTPSSLHSLLVNKTHLSHVILLIPLMECKFLLGMPVLGLHKNLFSIH